MLLYEGKAKKVFKTDISDEVLITFKDDATAFNGLKQDTIKGKGRVNLAFTRLFFNLLKEQGIKTHIVEFIDEITLRAKLVKIVPLEVVVRNYAAGSICKRTELKKGEKIDPVLCEFFLKDDSKGDPLITEQEILEQNLASKEEINILRDLSLKINNILSNFLDEKDITLVDFKLEFGKTSDGEIILADEISPDTCRFWLKGTTESLDKDVYREDKGDLVSSYTRLAEIIGVSL
jgi:phosphoribosylaminoimidazole-succinocarboxamide synthase